MRLRLTEGTIHPLLGDKLTGKLLRLLSRDTLSACDNRKNQHHSQYDILFHIQMVLSSEGKDMKKTRNDKGITCFFT
jgi:hypothetical protein